MRERRRQRNFFLNRHAGYAVLMIVTFVLVGLGVIIPYLVRQVQTESKISVAQKRSVSALQLAESGISQGYWKLLEKPTHWGDLMTWNGSLATAPAWTAGYRFDVTYVDPSGGRYRIRISSHNVGPGFPAAGERAVVEASAKEPSKDGDPDKAVYRAVRAIYKKP